MSPKYAPMYPTLPYTHTHTRTHIYIYMYITIMLIQESFLGEALDSKEMNDTNDELEEETLSLCDLPLYSDRSADWDEDLSLASNSLSSSQEDYFEFFSQELNPSATTTTSFPPENIIFCGKLIPYKQQATCEVNPSNLVEIKNQTNDKKKRRWRIFRWKFSSSKSSKRQVVSKNGARNTTTFMQQSPKKMNNTNKLGKGHGRLSIFTASSSPEKAKWYLYLFGISRFSPVVELRDIKGRQSRRRHCPSPPPPSPSSPPPMFGSQNHDDKVFSDRGWALWGLIRALSCGGNHQPTTMATASIGGCTPPE